MFSISKAYNLYCAGKSYFNPREFASLKATDRQQQNLFIQGLTETLKNQRNFVATRADAQVQLSAQLQAPLTPLGRVVATLTAFAQQVAATVANAAAFASRAASQVTQRVAQFLQQAGAMASGVAQTVGQTLSNVVAGITSLFFGFKKGNDQVEEREQRHLEDFDTVEVFTKSVVHETSGSGMGQSR
ncbi:MAG: hypothetical protein KTR14_03425 [Vampirovibrio sp.]|nr:hypothetical protein [Vampirovibrio sp.]